MPRKKASCLNETKVMKKRMKAYNDGVMKLLAKANESMAENQGKEGKN